MSLKEWIRPPRHLLWMFLSITSVLTAALGWLGWQLLQQDQKGNWDLWRVPVDGGQPEKVGLEKRCESISAHPNGRQIAFFLNEASINEVWVMENFLPGLKAAR